MFEHLIPNWYHYFKRLWDLLEVEPCWEKWVDRGWTLSFIAQTYFLFHICFLISNWASSLTLHLLQLKVAPMVMPSLPCDFPVNCTLQPWVEINPSWSCSLSGIWSQPQERRLIQGPPPNSFSPSHVTMKHKGPLLCSRSPRPLHKPFIYTFLSLIIQICSWGGGCLIKQPNHLPVPRTLCVSTSGHLLFL